MAELHVVLGASGHVGRIVAERLLDAGRRVRVVARSTERLAPFARRGAEVAAGSVEDAAFLRRAMEGARAAFVMLPPDLGPGVRERQDRVAAAIGDALEAAGVGHSVTLSSVGADRPSGSGPIAGLHVLERRLDRIAGLSPLHLRPGFFFENHLGSIGMMKTMGIVGSAMRADLKMAQIAAQDIGEVAGRRMAALDWQGRQVQDLHGERDLSMAEAAAILGKAVARPDVRYVQFAYPDAQQGMVQAGLPEELAALYVEMAKGFNEGHLAPTQPRSAATTTPTSLEQWAVGVFAPAYRAAG